MPSSVTMIEEDWANELAVPYALYGTKGFEAVISHFNRNPLRTYGERRDYLI